MFKQIEEFLEDPIAMDAFYLEMRLSNDPEMSKHAEDYNLMVLEMVKQTNIRGGTSAMTMLANTMAGLSGQG